VCMYLCIKFFLICSYIYTYICIHTPHTHIHIYIHTHFFVKVFHFKIHQQELIALLCQSQGKKESICGCLLYTEKVSAALIACFYNRALLILFIH
jgi:hypothetical protein